MGGSRGQGSRNSVFAGRPAACAGRVVPPEAGERPLKPRDGLRGRAARSDGASRSRYRAVGPGRSAEEGSPRTPSAPWALPGRWRRTRGPEEPSAMTPALGWAAGALRWRVTFASRSAELSEKNQRTDRGVTPQAPRNGPPERGARVLRLVGAVARRPTFSKTGFPISCGDTLGEPGATGAHRWRRTPPPRGSGERSPPTV